MTLALLAIALVRLTRNRFCHGDPSIRDLGAQCGDSGASTLGGRASSAAGWRASATPSLTNFVLRQGRTGSIVGKSLLSIRVVDATAHQPMGFWRSVIRQLTHVLDAMTLGVGYLWPLWDRRHQTFADKLPSTVCVSETR